jgi:hypothetical protein
VDSSRHRAHREPPHNFNELSLPLVPLNHVQVRWVRMYSCEHASSLYWGHKALYRFDDPAGTYGVLYLGSDVCCAFVETFGDSQGQDGAIEIGASELDRKCLSYVILPGDLRVVDLTGSGLANIGADARVTCGTPYHIPQIWSRALYEHPSEPDGIYYRSRHDPSRTSLALFDRVRRDSISEERRGPLTDARNTQDLATMLCAYRIAIL